MKNKNLAVAMEIIEKLNREEDSEVLAEVLDFYEYLSPCSPWQRPSGDVNEK